MLRPALLTLAIACGCSSEGRFKLSWEIRAGSVMGPRATCDPEAKVELESRIDGGEEVYRDVFPCSDMAGTTRPLPGDSDFSVTIRYLAASGAVLAATHPAREHLGEGTTDLGLVTIVRPEPSEALVINLRWERTEQGDDQCVPRAKGDGFVRRMAYRLADEAGVEVGASPPLGGGCPEPGGVQCEDALTFEALPRGDYVLDVTGLDEACRPCWRAERVGITHNGGVIEIPITRDPACG